MFKNRKMISRTLKDAVRAGGKAIRKIHNRDDFKIFTKQGLLVSDELVKKWLPTQYKTEADDSSHRAIVAIVGDKTYHGIPLLFEESNQNLIVEGTYISFDELDGTAEFIRREPGFMVLSQYVEDGNPVVSANFDPISERLFHASSNEGSFVDGNRITLHDASDINDARIIVNGRDKKRAESKIYWEFMHDRFGERLAAGLATGSRMAAILDKQYNVFVNFGSERLHIWDMGMVLNILEAGGAVSRKDGSSINFKKPGIIEDIVCSSNPKLHEQILKFIDSFTK